MSKKWHVLSSYKEDVVGVLLKNRGVKRDFLHPKDPRTLTAKDVSIDPGALRAAIARIKKAIKGKESIAVYADYDADGICAGAIMWEALHALGANVMPYIPHRVEEGYGLSKKGIDAVRAQYDPTLIITVDHGITAREFVSYAKKLHIDVIVTDHHVKPEKLPECIVVHTTDLAGSGVSWFVAKELGYGDVSLAAIGTIADLVPLVGANRSIVKWGLTAMKDTKRVGLKALMRDAGLSEITQTYEISHMIAPRLNAMGRLVHAMDALRLLCTKREDKAMILARQLGLTNISRQKLTEETTLHALQGISLKPKLLFVAHETYNQGVIGLVAGRLVEQYYRPAIVVSQGPVLSKASARSVTGFNIVEAIRKFKNLLVDVGGHPMAAGFTVETKNLDLLKSRMEEYTEKHLNDELLTRELRIDMELPITKVSEKLWQTLRDFEPFGYGSPEPVFVSRGVTVSGVRLVGADKKHLKLTVEGIEAIGFSMGAMYGKVTEATHFDVAYSVDMNVWNGTRTLQLKLRDIVVQ